jgi:hypothetical protein
MRTDVMSPSEPAEDRAAVCVSWDYQVTYLNFAALKDKISFRLNI